MALAASMEIVRVVEKAAHSRHRMSLVAVAMASVLLVLPLPAGRSLANPPVVFEQHAKRRAEALDALFAELKAAHHQTAADAIVARIWQQWMQSGRDDIDVLMSRAVANMAARDFGLSLLLLDEVIDLLPDFAEAWNKRATLYYHMGQYTQALADVERTLQLEPRHFGALAGRAAIHADAQRWKEALEAYRAALAINPFLQQRNVVLPELERKAGERSL